MKVNSLSYKEIGAVDLLKTQYFDACL